MVKRHQNIADSILRHIAEGDLTPGTCLPSPREMAASYDVSIQTMRRCILLLRRDGFIRSTRGSAMYITDKAPPTLTQRVAEKLAAYDQLNLAEAAALEIALHRHRVESVGG